MATLLAILISLNLITSEQSKTITQDQAVGVAKANGVDTNNIIWETNEK
ncbi:MAG: hypothetical protein POELPBGB_03204 [Bacteroidia bacterium]|nr:hypothetical protein [Bacteroidia bacterium]